jgi:Fe-S-cluster-containing dehydrogenase component
MADYKNYGLLVDYKYCSNCHSCEIACQEDKDLQLGQFGIKVYENGPFKKDDPQLDDAWDWDYVPIPTGRCDLCAERLDAGKKPMCVKHCLAFCLDYGPLEELAKKAIDLGEKVAIFRPTI